MLSPSFLWIPECFSTGSWQNLPVKKNIQPTTLKQTFYCFSSRSYSDLYAMMCLQTEKHFRLSILSESTGLFWIFFFHLLGYGRNWFLIHQNLSPFSVIYGFRNDLVFFWCFCKLLTMRQSKNWSNIWQYLVVWEVFVISKVRGDLVVVSFKTGAANFTVSHLGIAVKVHLLVSKFW